MKILITSLTLILLLLSSCAQEETCRENKQVLFNIGFYISETTNALNIDSITVFGINNNSITPDSLYKNVKNINKIALPLNNSAEESIFVLNINGTHDTLNVQYSNKEYFISYSCGMVITHHVDTVLSTSHLIKSYRILNRDINTTDVQHLQILL
ncbi:hypothetical protein SDC9_58411 [bioreactor metagenome]|uniref:Calcium-binding protein P n=1 Tax=bioreactor metagenome TaxID=1076179 RepID=A0A644X7A9_9ZZZZ|nr:DUF6452 family protein [Paludibacter sp.]